MIAFRGGPSSPSFLPMDCSRRLSSSSILVAFSLNGFSSFSSVMTKPPVTARSFTSFATATLAVTGSPSSSANKRSSMSS